MQPKMLKTTTGSVRAERPQKWQRLEYNPK